MLLIYHDQSLLILFYLQIAPHPGVTKNLSNKVKIMKTPLTYIYDTPGVNLPRPEDFDSAMKLAVVGGIPEHVTGNSGTLFSRSISPNYSHTLIQRVVSGLENLALNQVRLIHSYTNGGLQNW